MAKPKLVEMRIRPAKNGGHNVRHEYEATPRLAKGALSGGMMMDHPPAEEHDFGPKDGQALMKHIGQALALKGMMGGGQGNEEPAGD